MAPPCDRRWFLKNAAGVTLGAGLASFGCQRSTDVGNVETSVEPEPLFRISLAEWSLHRTLNTGEMDHLDFARAAVEDYSCEGVEYVNTFFFDKAQDRGYLSEMMIRAEDQGIPSLLIM